MKKRIFPKIFLIGIALLVFLYLMMNLTRREPPLNDSDLEPLRQRLAVDENDHQARYDLALALYASGDAEAAIDELLTLFGRNRAWNDDAAREQLIEIFNALGAESELVADSRRRLSTLLFA